jgi:hypothetical protein
MSQKQFFFSAVFMLWAAGCSSQVPLAVESANPAENASAEVKAPQEQKQLTTALKPREAALAAEAAVNEKYGLAVGNGGGSYQNHADDQAVAGDGFSAHGNAYCASGKSITIGCEWVADGKTEVTLTSDLPPAQYAAVEQVIRAALAATPKQ